MHIAELHTLDDEALGQALAEAFSALPEAEPARLALVRDRLPLTSKSAPSNRWAQLILIGILSGSGLAAAWWGVSTFFTPESETQQPGPETHTAPLSHAPAEAPAETPAITPPTQKQKAGERRSPIIYQQERY